MKTPPPLAMDILATLALGIALYAATWLTFAAL